MGMFAGISGASGKGGKGDYMPPDFDGRVRVLKCEAVPVRNAAPAFTVEFEIVDGPALAGLVPGQKKNWFQSTKEPGVAWPEILRFLYACAGMTVEDGDAKIAPTAEKTLEEQIVSAKNALAGRVIGLKTFVKITKERKVPFTVHKWSPAAAA